MALATDVMLLLLDPQKGKPIVAHTSVLYGLGGAQLLELAMSDSIRISGPGEAVRKGRVVPTAIAHPDPLVSGALATLRKGRPTNPPNAVMKLSHGLGDRIFAELRRDFRIREERDRVLGVFPRRRWYPTDRSNRAALRSQLAAVLIDGREPDQRESALIAILSSINAVPNLFPEADKKVIRQRAKGIAAGEWAAKAVKDAVAAAQAATATVIAAAAAAAAS
ncbi:GOLPH3/VPS74 family protein [Smaragdicoccus niigatensis]|uniref:GOLPH3/VPS74 family protein n=1 Tax=Smaragdicoccus niigatensis TaxID=359359 RepID=UPI00037B78E3|nr:GPP34 family phosphoprotein [Smaragdicoccus niigatensis]